MERDLSKIYWNPDTCGCQLEPNYEKTEQWSTDFVDFGKFHTDEAIAAVARMPVAITQDASRNLRFEIRRYKTWKMTLRQGVIESRVHPLTEKAPPPGERQRALIIKPCAWHSVDDGLGGEPLHPQLTWCPDVCICRWIQLHVGYRTKGALWGTLMAQLCREHAAEVIFEKLELGQIPQVVVAMLPKHAEPEEVTLDDLIKEQQAELEALGLLPVESR